MKRSKVKLWGSIVGAIVLIAALATLPGLVMASGTANVANKAEFLAALKNSSIDTIALTADISFTEKDGLQTVSRSGSTSVTIDGQGHTLEVLKSVPWLKGGSIFFKSGYRAVTVKDIALKGNAFDGMFDTKTAINFVFENITLDGPALLRMEKDGGNVVIKDSDLTLRKREGKSDGYFYSSEAVEMFNGELHLNGTVNIDKQNSGGDLDHDEVFYFRNKATKFFIDEGAVVTINNDSTPPKGGYWSGLTFICNETNQHEFTIGKDAQFSFVSKGGIITEEWPFNKFTVEEGANVDMRVEVIPNPTTLTCADLGVYFRARNINIAPNATWTVEAVGNTNGVREAVIGANNLTVGDNAVFMVKSSDTAANDLVRLYGKSPVITLDSPARVLFYHGDNPHTNPATFALSSTSGGIDGWAHDGKPADFTLKLIGTGVRAWKTSSTPVGIDGWDIAKEADGVWGTDDVTKVFTFQATYARDGALKKAAITAGAENLAPVGNPADPVNGLVTLKNASVLEFTGKVTYIPGEEPSPTPEPTPTDEPTPTPTPTEEPTPTQTPTPTPTPTEEPTPEPPVLLDFVDVTSTVDIIETTSNDSTVEVIYDVIVNPADLDKEVEMVFTDKDGNVLDLTYTTEFVHVDGAPEDEYQLVVTISNNSRLTNALKGGGVVTATATVTAGTAVDSDSTFIKYPSTTGGGNESTASFKIALSGPETLRVFRNNPETELVYSVRYLPEVGYAYPEPPYSLIYTDISGNPVDTTDLGVLDTTWTEVGDGIYQLKILFDTATLSATLNSARYVYVDVTAYAQTPIEIIDVSERTTIMLALA
ncbi:MAG: hypothetical protein LBC41_01570 [Clostridiales bacterium]|jgi:type II secretory pathway pseudopilin PulG|nr:hypothetical protein [Clostridiales bacterium]